MGTDTVTTATTEMSGMLTRASAWMFASIALLFWYVLRLFSSRN